MKYLSIASTKQNGHTRTPSLPAFLAFNVSPRSSCELVIPEKTYSPFEPCFSRSSRLISRLSSGRSPPCLVSNLHQDIWLRLFSFLFFENFSRRVCGLRNSWMHTRNSRLFICLWSEFPLGWPWTPRFLWNTTLREECKREKRARYFSCIPPLRYGLSLCTRIRWWIFQRGSFRERSSLEDRSRSACSIPTSRENDDSVVRAFFPRVIEEHERKRAFFWPRWSRVKRLAILIQFVWERVRTRSSRGEECLYINVWRGRKDS